MPSPPADLRSIEALLAIMRSLRSPDGGCPWDREQSFETIAPYTIEEAYEVAEAIAHGDRTALKNELGDLLFQTVYHAQLAAEEGAFTFADVVAAIAEKLVRRHPHVFGSASIKSADDQNKAWEAMKAGERSARGQASPLDDVPLALPALMRAQKLQGRAARVGFEWPQTQSVIAKLREEIEEFSREVEAGECDAAAAEFGDVLFVLVNLARRLGVDAEDALRRANSKFETRLRHIAERCRASGREMSDVPLAELEALWREAKDHNREPAPAVARPQADE
jgi:tetrapyrrole methylase family protein/MazG family protein/ATP diphosphatase